MSQKPKKDQLREFLRQRLDTGEIKGLVWTNQEVWEFRLPWKHQHDADWEEEDARIVREWGMHKGRDTSKLADLKATFRSGLKKTRYVEVIDEPEGYKICRLVYPEGEEEPVPALATASGVALDQDSPAGEDMVTNAMNESGDQIPATIAHLSATPSSSLTSSIPSLSDSLSDLDQYLDGTKELPPLNQQDVLELFEGMDMVGVEENTVEPTPGHNGWAQSPETQANMGYAPTSPRAVAQSQQRGDLISLPSDFTTGHYNQIDFQKVELPGGKIKLEVYDIFVLVKHRERVLNRHHSISERGFRIVNLKPNEQDLYEDLDAEVVIPRLPEPQGQGTDEDVYITRARGLLENVGPGLYIFADEDNNIHAVRISNLRIFYANTIGSGNQAAPHKLLKKEDTIVFNCAEYREAFEQWVKEPTQARKPDVRVIFTFGETWDLAAKPLKRCHLSVTIASARLLFQKIKLSPILPREEAMEMSNSSSWNDPNTSSLQHVSTGMEQMSVE